MCYKEAGHETSAQAQGVGCSFELYNILGQHTELLASKIYLYSSFPLIFGPCMGHEVCSTVLH